MSNYKKILILDTGIGNVGSVFRAINNIGYLPIISNNKADFEDVTHIIFPGVGSFDHGMEKLLEYDLCDILTEAVIDKKTPFLGICLGMQLLASTGYENNKETKGLNFLSGKVEQLDIDTKYKIPHMGWNEVNHDEKNILFQNIQNHKDFYFVHSYIFKTENENQITAKTNYGKEFVSAINKDNIYGVQFHPEKSLTDGIKLISNFLNI